MMHARVLKSCAFARSRTPQAAWLSRALVDYIRGWLLVGARPVVWEYLCHTLFGAVVITTSAEEQNFGWQRWRGSSKGD
jgi:hypothetical protein